MLPHAESKLTSQRIQYTILDQCAPFAGNKLVEIFANRIEIQELAPAFQALILTRSTQWGIKNKVLKECAMQIIEEMKHMPWPENKSHPSSLNMVSNI